MWNRLLASDIDHRSQVPDSKGFSGDFKCFLTVWSLGGAQHAR
jgi:hypothetical protein